MSTTNKPLPEKPWFKQFWPWFIMLIPACGVVAGIATVVIASQNAPQMTQDDIGRFARVQHLHNADRPADPSSQAHEQHAE